MTKDNKLLEKVANLSHNQWAGWTQYLFSKCSKNSDGTLTIPKWAVERWNRQIATSYKNLSKDEKNSDRKEAEKYIKLISKQIEKFLTS